MFQSLHTLLSFLAAELFDTRCYVCEQRTRTSLLCKNCFCFSVGPQPISIDPLSQICSTFWLEEKALELIHRAKYYQEQQFLRIFKKSVELPSLLLKKETVLVPVPISFERFQTRGFNQAWLLCQWLRENQGVPFVFTGLLKVKETESQSSLSKSQRKKNLKKVFQWNSNVEVPESVVLIDDIFTTGVTLSECAKALKKAGVQEVSAWTLFRTPTNLRI